MASDQVTSRDELSNDLLRFKETICDKCGLLLNNFRRSHESEEYDACAFNINGKTVQYRASKITPAKVGQFVTIWKRNGQGVTEPFAISDDLDFVIVTSRRGDDIGHFIFPKSVLAEKGIVTVNGRDGKRGIRVYPPWDVPESKQAVKTQDWQRKYFVSIEHVISADLILIKKLFELS